MSRVQFCNAERVKDTTACNKAIADSRKNIRRGVKVLRPGDAGFAEMAAQCTPIAQVLEHHQSKAYAFCAKNMRRG